MSDDSKALTREFLAERDLRIFKMRQAGITTNEIARRFGVSTSVVSKAISRQLEKMNREALNAYPEVLRMELERLDALQAAIWPMTQHRRVTMDDGQEVSVEPDMKAIQQVLSIMDRRSKLLGMEQSNLSIQMDVSTDTATPIRVTMAGELEGGAAAVDAFDPAEEAKQLLELMARSGVLPEEDVQKMLGTGEEVVEADIVEEYDDTHE
jgi:transposase-like protein